MSSSHSPPGESSDHESEQMPFCTHQCLLGLIEGGSLLDASCPNAKLHGNNRHQIDQQSFIDRLSQQLFDDHKGLEYTGCNGGTGFFYRLRLQSHGYTVVAKGFSDAHSCNVARETWIYAELRLIQGDFVPVHIGNISLEKPDYQEGRNCDVYDLMLLSFAGDPIIKYLTKGNCHQLLERTDRCFQAIHVLGVLHGDPYTINVVMDGEDGQIMVIDFESSNNIWDYDKEDEVPEESQRLFRFERYRLRKDFEESV